MKTSRFNIRIEPEVKAAWFEAAEAEGLKLSAWITMLANERAAIVKIRRGTTLK